MFKEPFFVPASIILLLAVPLILGLIPPNKIYGVRTAETLADKRLWYQANRYGGWTFFISSLIYLGIAGIFPSAAGSDTDMRRWGFHLAAFVSPIIISFFLIRNYIKRLK